MVDLAEFIEDAVSATGASYFPIAIFKLLTLSATTLPVTLAEGGDFELNPALALSLSLIKRSIRATNSISCISELLYFLHSVNLLN